MTRKEILKFAELKIKEGKSRQDIFDELRESSDKTIQDLAKIISLTSPLTLRRKYNWLNNILIVLLFITIILKIITGIPLVLKLGIIWFPLIFVLPILNVILFIGVIGYKPRFHNSVGLIALLSLINGITKINEFNVFVLVDILIIVSLIFLGFYLQSKLSPKFKMVKEKYLNDKGYTKIRDKIEFEY